MNFCHSWLNLSGIKEFIGKLENDKTYSGWPLYMEADRTIHTNINQLHTGSTFNIGLTMTSIFHTTRNSFISVKNSLLFSSDFCFWRGGEAMEKQEVCKDEIFSTEIAKRGLGEEGQRQRRLSSEVFHFLDDLCNICWFRGIRKFGQKALTYLVMVLTTLVVLPTTFVYFFWRAAWDAKS